MKEKEDLRVIRTRKLLCDALLELMQEMPYDKIGVNMICEKSMIHRATFYNHFTDKSDLLNYILDEFEEEVFTKTLESCKDLSTKQSYLKLFENVVDIFDARRDKFKMILGNTNEKIINFVLSSTDRCIRYLVSKNKVLQTSETSSDTIVNFFTGGIVMMVYSWLMSEKPTSKEDLMNFFDSLISKII